MRTIARIACLLAVTLIGPAAFARAEQLDLSTYLKRVVSNNPDLILSRLASAAADESAKQARSALLPSIGASGDYNRSLHDIEAPTPVASLPGGGPLVYRNVKQNMDNDLRLSVGISQNIFDAEALARFAQANRNRTIQHTVMQYTRQTVLTAAKKLYARAQLAASVASMRKTAAETSQAIYKNLAMKYKAGTATELDLRMAEVDWKSDVTATAEAERDAELAMMSLKALAGIPLKEKVNLAKEPADLPELPAMPSLDTVLGARSDYRAQLLAKDMADIAYRASIASFLPTVTGSFNYSYDEQGNKSSFNDYNYTAVQLGLNVTIPIFTGGYRRSLVESAKIQQSEAAERIRKKRDQIEQSLVSLHLRLQEARKRIDSARSLVDVAQQASTLAQAGLANGLGTTLSVSQANTKLAAAKLGLENAIFEYRAAFDDWELATGEGGNF